MAVANTSVSTWTVESNTTNQTIEVETTSTKTDTTTASEWDDATWILTSALMTFTMQLGLCILELSCVSVKNEVNIVMKNLADILVGGISYWMLGYGLTYGTDPGTNAFCGVGKFFIDPDDISMGIVYSHFVFQSSFATKATSIVSGAIAERVRFPAYLLFTFFNTFIYCIPAHWVWSEFGWLRKLGVVDVAGDGPVHVLGGMAALMGALVVKPRKGRFSKTEMQTLGSSVGSLVGLIILWWSWLAFNSGSSYGITDGKWKLASRAATNTIMAANCGGVVALLVSFAVNKKKFYVSFLVNGVLGALVSITACCSVTSVKESMVIGSVGALLTLLADDIIVRLHIDDPVSAFPVHGMGGMWGLLAAGLFARKDHGTSYIRDGLVSGGGFYLLGVQMLSFVSISAWSLLMTFIILKVIDLIAGLHLCPEDEEVGSDIAEHNACHFRLTVDKRVTSTTPERCHNNVCCMEDRQASTNSPPHQLNSVIPTENKTVCHQCGKDFIHDNCIDPTVNGTEDVCNCDKEKVVSQKEFVSRL